MFLGTHHPRLDDKGRLFLPAKFRDELAEGLVITKGQDHCLFVFTPEEFRRRGEARNVASPNARSVREYNRLFFSSASDEVPDKQGRITVPPALRAYAGLTRECAVIGANTHVEVWDAARWEAYVAAAEPEYAALEEEVPIHP